ncbi:MAG: NUDIX domain-containing protein [Candidatus Pacebacteria bacterium]|nr:NUDIX domain-containing protein [Candidatus Paceibacterota bacterium]
MNKAILKNTMDLCQDIARIIKREICDSEETYLSFLQRLEEGNLTRDENVSTHFGTFFLPFNPKTRQLFLVHHKKSGLWIAPGGHIDKGEILWQTLNREISEELGVKEYFQSSPNPFLLTITEVNNNVQPCKAHYDVWYLMATDGGNFNVDLAEFHDTKWLSLDEAKKIVTAPTNITALNFLDDCLKQGKL